MSLLSSDFLSELIETAFNVAAIALIGYWASKHFTRYSPKVIGFALAVGLLYGRGQADGLTSAAKSGSVVGGALVLGLLWVLWFKRPQGEARHG